MITALILLAIFGGALGGRLGTVAGVSYGGISIGVHRTSSRRTSRAASAQWRGADDRKLGAGCVAAYQRIAPRRSSSDTGPSVAFTAAVGTDSERVPRGQPPVFAPARRRPAPGGRFRE